MDWVEWKGESVGNYDNTVCICVVTYANPEWTPVYAIAANAYCISNGTLDGLGWMFYEGRPVSSYTRTHHLNRFRDRNDEIITTYDPSRGDKIYYCTPRLPDGSQFDLNDIKRRQLRGWAIVKDMELITK